MPSTGLPFEALGERVDNDDEEIPMTSFDSPLSPAGAASPVCDGSMPTCARSRAVRRP